MNDLYFQGQSLGQAVVGQAVVRCLEGKLTIDPSQTLLCVGVLHLPSSVVVEDIMSMIEGSLSFFLSFSSCFVRAQACLLLVVCPSTEVSQSYLVAIV